MVKQFGNFLLRIIWVDQTLVNSEFCNRGLGGTSD